MKKTKLAKAIGFAIAGAALTAGSVSTASASSTTSYHLVHTQGSTPCAPCAAGETDGWVWGGVADSTPTGTDTIETSSPTINSAPGAGWVGTAATNKTPFGYTGGGTLNWALEFTGAGTANTRTISNADAIATYGVSADIDSAKGAWSDNISTNVGVAGGWRHDLDFGLFKSATTGLVTLTASPVGGPADPVPAYGFTIFKGMDTSAGSYNHHGAWNSNTNNQPGAPTSASLPGGGRNLPVSSIVAYSIGNVNPSTSAPGTNINTITFNALEGEIYTIALGGYRNGDWTTTSWGYNLEVSQVPVPGAVWLFGSAMAGLLGFGRRNRKSAA